MGKVPLSSRIIRNGIIALRVVLGVLVVGGGRHGSGIRDKGVGSYDGVYGRVYRLWGSRLRGYGVDSLEIRTKGRYVNCECGDYGVIGVWVYGCRVQS